MEEWRADHSEVQNFPLPLVCSQTFMIQEEQKENCLTHDHALVHTAFSFYSHQKSRIKYFLVKKKKKKKGGTLLPFGMSEPKSVWRHGGQQFQILLCSALTFCAREATQTFRLRF